MSKKLFKRLMDVKRRELAKWAERKNIHFKLESEVKREKEEREREKERLNKRRDNFNSKKRYAQ